MVPLAVGEQRPRLILHDELLQHGNQMLQRIPFGIFQIQRMHPLVDRMVHAELHAGTLHGIPQLHAEVAVRPHVPGVPVPGVGGGVEAEAVVMLGNEVDVFGTRFFEQLRPFAGVKELGCEVADEVGVLKLFAVDAVVEAPRRMVGCFELPLIPFGILTAAGVGGDGVETPVDEDAELGFSEPGGNGTGVEGLPVVFVKHSGTSSE